MLDHFDLLAPLYEKIIPSSGMDVLQSLLNLPVEGLLLDAAGGTGRASKDFGQLTGGIVVCDSSLQMLRQACCKNNVLTVRAELEDIPFPSNLFDRIALVDAFHHLRDQEKSLKELLRILKPGGRMVIEEPDIGNAVTKTVAVMERIFLFRSKFIKPAVMVQMVKSSGATAEIVSKGGLRVWIVVDKPAFL